MMKTGWVVFTVAAVMAMTAGKAVAQYDEPRDYQPTDIRSLSAGLSAIEFRPKTTDAASDSGGILFRALMPVLDFRNGLMDLYFGYTRYSQNDVSHPAILVGINVGTEFPVLGKRASALLIPVLIAADFTRADASGATRNSFNVASVGLGMGVKYRIVNRSIDAWLSTVVVAHYSTEGFSVNTGFSAAFLAEFIAYFPEIPIGDGVTFGYRFRFQNWSMQNSAFNYRMIVHGPSIGIAF